MQIVPITIWRESRGEGHDGMVAVGHVILNRSKAGGMWPSDPEKVCLQPYQFSCWNTDDPQRAVYPLDTDMVFLDSQRIWDQVNSTADPTGGATYYLNPAAVKVNQFATPQYVKTAEIGHHFFYRKA